MEHTRFELHDILQEIIGEADYENCHFQAPPNNYMEYPCILYRSSKPAVEHANDGRYFKQNCYTITIIDEDPDSEIPAKLEEAFPFYLEFDRVFVSDNLYHFVYQLYF